MKDIYISLHFRHSPQPFEKDLSRFTIDKNRNARYGRDSVDKSRRQQCIFVSLCCTFVYPNRHKVIL